MHVSTFVQELDWLKGHDAKEAAAKGIAGHKMPITVSWHASKYLNCVPRVKWFTTTNIIFWMDDVTAMISVTYLTTYTMVGSWQHGHLHNTLAVALCSISWSSFGDLVTMQWAKDKLCIASQLLLQHAMFWTRQACYYSSVVKPCFNWFCYCLLRLPLCFRTNACLKLKTMSADHFNLPLVVMACLVLCTAVLCVVDAAYTVASMPSLVTVLLTR